MNKRNFKTDFKSSLMKNFNKYIFLSIMLVLLAAIVSCATPPTEDMNRAHDAVARAENNADAVSYAGNLVTRARQALDNMQVEADARRYEEARNLASEAISLAERAIEEGSIAAIRAREETASLLNSLGTSITETSNSLDAARANNLDLDYAYLGSQLENARRLHNEARQDLQANQLQSAVNRANTIRSTLSAINTALTNAVQALSRK